MAQPLSKAIRAMENLLPKTLFENEPEEYILTKEEEEYSLRQIIGAKKNQLVMKWAGRGITVAEIEVKLSEIDWDKEVDKAELFKHVNSDKHYRLWEAKQRIEEKKLSEDRRENLKKTWTALQFFKMMKFVSKNEYGQDLIVDDNTKKIIVPLCYFLSEDERFETELGFSLKKGIVFRGISGLGKTFIPKCIAANELHPMFVVSMLEITEEMKDNGAYSLPASAYSKFYIDDVGSEDSSVVQHYGTKLNWFKNFLEIYYLRSQQYNRILLSTNITFAQFEDKYGFRVRSRMKDMFNVIDLGGIDLRGK
jgi:hypothetical protein